MQAQRIEINAAPVGEGQERICYRHPLDATRLIKIQRGDNDRQTRRELRFYRDLERRGMRDFSHIPRFHGFVDTSLGRGFVVDLIADYDGQPSKSLWWHFQRGCPVAEFEAYLDDLGRYLLQQRIVFSVDMGRYNVLFQKLSPQQARLVVIDGLGDHAAINWPDAIGFFARRKIARRWRRFIDRLRNYSAESMRAFDGQPQTLAPAYRRSG